MERIKEIIGKYLPLAWWSLLTLMALSACICCAVYAASGCCRFLAIMGAVGSSFSVPIYGWQTYGEWIEIKTDGYDDED